MMYTLRAGTTNTSVLVLLRDAATGAPRPGLVATDARAAFLRAMDPGATTIELTPGLPETWTAGGFVEVDPLLLPGVYRLDLPNEVVAAGSNRAFVTVQAPGAVADPVDIDLVAFDPQDPVRLGMTALGPDERIAALRGAFPRLAAKEIREAEARLADRRGADD